MKKTTLLFTILFLTLLFIPSKALTSENILESIYAPESSISESIMKSIIAKADSLWGTNLWLNNYYLISHEYSAPNSPNYWILFIDKQTSKMTVYSLSPSNIKLEHTDDYSFYFTYTGTYIPSGTYDGNTIRVVDYSWLTHTFQGQIGKLLYTNLPVKFTNSSGQITYLANRNIPNSYFSTNHPMYVVPSEVLPGEQVDSIVDTNLVSILDEFDVDLLFENLESVLEQIYGFIESAFLSLNNVIAYITGSLNNVVSFISSNITIISIISMVYLALPSILRDLFTLALSTSVVFIMLRRFI
jgi:hypothetical protein